MNRRPGSSRFLGIFLLVFLSAGTGWGETKPTGGDNAAMPGKKEFALPQKHDLLLGRNEKRGRALYEYYCALCHGKRGDADGFNATNLKTPPTRHTDPILMGTLSDTQVQRIIKEGGQVVGRSAQMPPWGGVLKSREIADLTAFIRTLAVPAKK
jgi:mono/diheme cytochrome c family protein